MLPAIFGGCHVDFPLESLVERRAGSESRHQADRLDRCACFPGRQQQGPCLGDAVPVDESVEIPVAACANRLGQHPGGNTDSARELQTEIASALQALSDLLDADQREELSYLMRTGAFRV